MTISTADIGPFVWVQFVVYDIDDDVDTYELFSGTSFNENLKKFVPATETLLSPL